MHGFVSVFSVAGKHCLKVKDRVSDRGDVLFQVTDHTNIYQAIILFERSARNVNGKRKSFDGIKGRMP